MKSKAVIASLFVAVIASQASAQQNLYARIGAMPTVAALVDKMVDLETADPAFYNNPRYVALMDAYTRPGVKFLLTESLASGTGGASSVPSMGFGEIMRSLAMTAEQYDRAIVLTGQAMNELSLVVDVQNDIREWMHKEYTKVKPDDMVTRETFGNSKSLYARLGGFAKIANIVDIFVFRLATNPTIGANENVVKAVKKPDFSFAGLKVKLTEQLIAASGGPFKYTGRSMKAAHKGMFVTGEQWDTSIAILSKVMTEANIGSKEQHEVRALIGTMKADIIGQ